MLTRGNQGREGKGYRVPGPGLGQSGCVVGRRRSWPRGAVANLFA